MTRRNEKKLVTYAVVRKIVEEAMFVLNLLLIVLKMEISNRYRKYYDKACYSMKEKMFSQKAYLDSLLSDSNRVCHDQLRMNRSTFTKLCQMLRERSGLKDAPYVSLEEKVASFLYVLAHHNKVRVNQLNFKRSGYTVNFYFHEVLNGILRLQSHLLVKPEPVEADSTDERWNMFEGCLGALDGTYIKVNVGDEDKVRYRSRKGETAINVLGVCDRNMNFSFVFSGWEGSATDSRVLRDAVTRQNGLKIPQGQYYLCDAGYTNGPGFLAPYRQQRYHLATWGDGALEPQSKEEYFNMKHAKARNVIERAFGVLKLRWSILRGPSHYRARVHGRIVVACCLLHNFIRKEMLVDPFEEEYDNTSDGDSNNGEENSEEQEMINTVEATDEWQEFRDNLAQDHYDAWRG